VSSLITSASMTGRGAGCGAGIQTGTITQPPRLLVIGEERRDEPAAYVVGRRWCGAGLAAWRLSHRRLR
jgi:hypothetical protein